MESNVKVVRFEAYPMAELTLFVIVGSCTYANHPPSPELGFTIAS